MSAAPAEAVQPAAANAAAPTTNLFITLSNATAVPAMPAPPRKAKPHGYGTTTVSRKIYREF
jgi:hypothetical protein